MVDTLSPYGLTRAKELQRMTQGLRWIAWFLGITLLAGTARAADLAGEIARLASDPDLSKMRVGYAVMDCDAPAGQLLAARNADALFVPASNLKILTTGVALDVLGSDFRFETKLLLDTTGGRTRLTLVGSGDPALLHTEALRQWERMKVPPPIANSVAALAHQWANALKLANVRQIDEFVLDARIFDDERIPADSLKWRNNEPQGTYAVGVWGFNIAGNAATINVSGRVGRAPWITGIEPPLRWRVDANRATSASVKKSTFALQVNSSGDLLALDLEGVLPAGDTAYDTRIENTPACAAAMITSLLTQEGVHVAGWRMANAQDPAANGQVVEPVLATPLSTVLYGANTFSNNLFAEALAKRIAAAKSNPTGATVGPGFVSGSWRRAREVLPELVASRLGSDCPLPVGFAMFDGSGLDDRSRMSPALAVHWMRSFMNSGARAADYFHSFAKPRSEGTLKKRFANLDCQDLLVYGKSGYIDGASALSGVVVNLATRRSIAYSIFCNEQRGGAFNLNAARALQESAVAAVARFTRTLKPSAQPIAIGN